MDFKALIGDSDSGVGGGLASKSMGIDTDCFPSLPLKTRIYGFITCFLFGILLSFLVSAPCEC